MGNVLFCFVFSTISFPWESFYGRRPCLFISYWCYQAPKLHDWRARLTTRPLPASQLMVYHCGLPGSNPNSPLRSFFNQFKICFVLCFFSFSFFINLPIYSFIVILLIILYAKGLLWKRLNFIFVKWGLVGFDGWFLKDIIYHIISHQMVIFIIIVWLVRLAPMASRESGLAIRRSL